MLRLDNGESGQLITPLTTQNLAYQGAPNEGANAPAFGATHYVIGTNLTTGIIALDSILFGSTSLLGSHAHTGADGSVQLNHANCFSSYGLDNHTEYILATGARSLSGILSYNPAQPVGNFTAPQEIVNKLYVDTAIAGVGITAHVHSASAAQGGQHLVYAQGAGWPATVAGELYINSSVGAGANAGYLDARVPGWIAINAGWDNNNDSGGVIINNGGYAGFLSRYREFNIYNGKGGSLADFAYNQISLHTGTGITSNTQFVLTADNCWLATHTGTFNYGLNIKTDFLYVNPGLGFTVLAAGAHNTLGEVHIIFTETVHGGAGLDIGWAHYEIAMYSDAGAGINEMHTVYQSPASLLNPFPFTVTYAAGVLSLQNTTANTYAVTWWSTRKITDSI